MKNGISKILDIFLRSLGPNTMTTVWPKLRRKSEFKPDLSGVSLAAL